MTVVKKRSYEWLWTICLLGLASMASYGAAMSPEWVEKYYSGRFYVLTAQKISHITGIFPFSVAEVLGISICLFIFIGFLYHSINAIRKRQLRIQKYIRYISTGAIFFSTLYFLFIGMWGLNYYRLPFAVTAELDVRPASLEELEALCRQMIERANRLRSLQEEDGNGAMKAQNGIEGILKRAQMGYDAASHLYPVLGGSYGRPKKILFSHIMSYQGIGGIYFPFTAEANVNALRPEFMIPFITTHEMAHQRGFAREDEANFIGYIASVMHPHYDFQYSGVMLGLLYAMEVLEEQDKTLHGKLTALYSPGIQRDLEARDSHYEQYRGLISRVSNRVNHVFLQANGQNEGIQSYGLVVDLLIARYRDSF